MKHFSPKKILIWVMFLILFYTIFTYYSDLEKIQNHLANVSVVYFIPLFCILTVSIMLRSIFQYLLLNNLGIKISFRDNLKIFFVGLSMLITPGGSGVLIKSYFLKKKYGYAITKTLPAVFMERYFELIGIITIIIFSLLFVYSYQSTIIVLVSITIVLVLFYIIKTKTLVKLLIKILKKIKPFKTVIGEEDEIIESLGSFLKVKFLMKALTAIILITFLESTMFYLGFLSFNIDLDYINSIQIFYTSILFG